MRVLLLASHAVAEYDDIRMFHHLGYEVFAPGGYEDPSSAGEGARPALPDVPYYADLAALCERQRREYGEPGTMIDWAKGRLHPDVIDWADVIIVHHFPDRWIGGQWQAIKHKRVIWRTCGQSNPDLEACMAQFVDQGLQIVRYSPMEGPHFGEQGSFAGQHALIRFGKFLDDYHGWTGNDAVVGNVTQDMAKRGNACGLDFWNVATSGLPVQPAGYGSTDLRNGIGGLSYDRMLDYLRRIRVYLYTGTTPASYTLGLMEAMLTGTPVVSIGPEAWGGEWGGQALFEGHELAKPGFDDPRQAHDLLRTLLVDKTLADELSVSQRQFAQATFDVEVVGQQWRDFLESV